MAQAIELNPGELANLPLSLIDPDPDQPRKDFDEDYLAQLADSIKVDGVIQPIVVRQNPATEGRWFIVAGENRWRASKLAKKKTIPVVRRDVDGISLLLVQLKENHQRKDLNPMEWALAFQTMHRTHGLKQAEIEKTLKDAGVGQFGRAYISNTIRLLDLPDWAQGLIRANALTAAHGKYLIPAMASEKVLEVLRARLTEENWAPTTRELQQEIYYLFERLHENLTNWKTDFDYQKKCVATGCQKMRKISHPNRQDSTFCLDTQCHAILQAEHEREEAARERPARPAPTASGEPRALTVSEDNRIDVNQHQLQFHRDYRYLGRGVEFDMGDCEGCLHRHIAVKGDDTDEADACFLISCYMAKVDEAWRAKRLAREWMAAQIGERLTRDPRHAARLLAWVASACPDGMNAGNEIDFEPTDLYNWDDDDPLQQILLKHQALSIERFLDMDDHLLMALADLAVTKLREPELRRLWARFGLRADDYRIDEAYIAAHDAKELTVLLSAIGWPPATFAELANAENAGTVAAFALDHRDAIGTPSEIRYALERILMVSQEAEEEEEGEDELDDTEDYEEDEAA